jgi:hypothetical protein
MAAQYLTRGGPSSTLTNPSMLTLIGSACRRRGLVPRIALPAGRDEVHNTCANIGQRAYNVSQAECAGRRLRRMGLTSLLYGIGIKNRNPGASRVDAHE